MNNKENKEETNPEESQAVSVTEKDEIGRRLAGVNPFAAFKDEVVNFPVFLPGAVPASPDAPWISPLCIVADLLRIQGVSDTNIKAGVVTHLVLNSGAYGFPMGEEITGDEEGEGVKMLNACLNLTPPVHTLELPKFSLEIMLREREELKGRTIIGFNGKGFQKDSLLLNLYLQRQLLKNQETVQVKYDTFFQEVVIEGPTSCTILNQDRENRILTHPSFIHLKPTQGPTNRGFPSIEEFEKEKSFAWVKASLERLHYRPVKIPFMDQLNKHLISSKVKYAQERCETFSRILSVITILNNPVPLLKSELFSRFLGLGIGKALSKDISVESPKTEELVATRADYFYLWASMDDLWASRDDSLTDLERRIFNVIKHQNLEGLKEQAFVNTENETETLLGIMQNERCWVPQDKIFEYVNRDGGEPVGVSTLYRELKSLAGKEVILSRDDSKSKNKKLFAICVSDISENIRLPHPSEISDGIFDKPLQVLNPLSGAVETI